MAIGGKKTSAWAYLNEYECFTLYNNTNLAKARQTLIDRGVKNPRTGKPPTKMSIRVAALRYALKNPEKARHEITIVPDGKWAYDREAYYTWLNVEVAKKIFYSKKRYEEWLRKYYE